MPSDLRFVLDTNVVVSALLFRKSVVRQAFDRARANGTLLVSKATAEELNSVLRRTTFDRYVTEAVRLEFLNALVREATLAEITESIAECRDPTDNKFLELAVSAKATCIISGDDDLLVLAPFRGIPILTPHQFMNYSFARPSETANG